MCSALLFVTQGSDGEVLRLPVMSKKTMAGELEVTGSLAAQVGGQGCRAWGLGGKENTCLAAEPGCLSPVERTYVHISAALMLSTLGHDAHTNDGTPFRRVLQQHLDHHHQQQQHRLTHTVLPQPPTRPHSSSRHLTPSQAHQLLLVRLRLVRRQLVRLRDIHPLRCVVFYGGVVLML